MSPYARDMRNGRILTAGLAFIMPVLPVILAILPPRPGAWLDGGQVKSAFFLATFVLFIGGWYQLSVPIQDTLGSGWSELLTS